MEGYEQFCRVRGTMVGRAVDGLGQRGHSWGNPDWDKIALTRTRRRVVRRRLRLVLATVRPVKATTTPTRRSGPRPRRPSAR